MKPIDQIRGHNLLMCEYSRSDDAFDYASHHSCGHPWAKHGFDGEKLCDQPCTEQDWEHCSRNTSYVK